MNRGGLRYLSAALAAFVAFVGVVPRAGAAAQSPPPKAYIVVDAGNGRVLESSNDHQALPPASLAKVMTALTAIERLPSNATITVSPLAASQPASRISMVAGQKWKFAAALASLMIVSANDAAYAIAETAGGSVPNFVVDETAAARRFGMRDSTFADPAGLDDTHSYKGGPRMSAFDIAISARNALSVPLLRLDAASRQQTFVDPAGRTRSLVNHNKMLDGNTHGYAGANGMKTGFTNLAGHTLITTATRNGRTLIAVILNTYDAYGWAAQVLDTAFAMPANAKGTGERLPPVRVSPYGQRVADRASFLALTTTTTAPAAALAVATTTSTTPAEKAAVVGSTVPPTTMARTTRTAPVGDSGGSATTAKTTSGSKGRLTKRNLVVGAIILFIGLLLLRRRAVRRQRQRRLAQRKAVKNAMRRGSLTVVDGRYRAGERTGPPIESHVRIHRSTEERRTAP